MKRVSSRQLSDLARKNNMPMCLCGCGGVARDTYNFSRELVLATEKLNEKKMPEILTSHIYPPIPIRSFDWCAFFAEEEGYEDARIGWGATEEEAIADLKEQVDG